MSRKKSETRIRILQATLHMLENEHGSEVRMSDIAKQSGISRQALYLHFPTRAELLTAATKHVDEIKQVDARLARSRAAQSGFERLDAYIDAWGNYIPEIYGVARAIMAMMATDEEAASAWSDRMQAMRHGCAAAVKALAADNQLKPGLTQTKATDILWTLLSVRNWEHLVQDCGWEQKAYVKHLQMIARSAITIEHD